MGDKLMRAVFTGEEAALGELRMSRRNVVFVYVGSDIRAATRTDLSAAQRAPLHRPSVSCWCIPPKLVARFLPPGTVRHGRHFFCSGARDSALAIAPPVCPHSFVGPQSGSDRTRRNWWPVFFLRVPFGMVVTCFWWRSRQCPRHCPASLPSFFRWAQSGSDRTSQWALCGSEIHSRGRTASA